MVFEPLDQINRRIANERDDSDAALFWSLMLKGELIVKLTVAGLVATIRDDREESRYRHNHSLVRADGIGKWAEVLGEVVRGPSAALLSDRARELQIQLTKREPTSTWVFRAVKSLGECLRCVKSEQSSPTGRVQLVQWFRDFATLRNATRGHGAQVVSTWSKICPNLEESLDLMENNLNILNWPWAYIQQNLSGKYRVAYWGEQSDSFEELKKHSAINLPKGLEEGLYVENGERLCNVELIDSDIDRSDVWIANGKFNEKTYELLSYITDSRSTMPSAPYLRLSRSLPHSETHGFDNLDAVGNTFTNLPSSPLAYVKRRDLEDELAEQLRTGDRHPVVTLTGYGGIGKTSLALTVVNDLMALEECPYDLVIWFSARDVDLLSSGPKPVQPRGVSVKDFATEYATLMGRAAEVCKGAKRNEDYLADEMGHNSDKDFTKLFIFDNFETTSDSIELYNWIDAYIRAPNKVLITSRERRFKGDYAVDVVGMNDDECLELIRTTAGQLGIRSIITSEYEDQIVQESRGHPYVIKLILGEVAKDRQARKVERIMASQDNVLDALFERSYGRLSRAAQRTFLTLCSWRSSRVPRMALEAVLLRPQNEELMDVDSAIDELVRMSFVEEVGGERDDAEITLDVPLSARLFGEKKLRVSYDRALIQDDSRLLQMFGAVTRTTSSSTEYRIERLFKNVAISIERGDRELDDVMPILEYVSTKFDVGWIYSADLVRESGNDDIRQRELDYLKRYVENSGGDFDRVSGTWTRISEIYESRHDLWGAVDALSQVCGHPEISIQHLSNTANRINTLFRTNDTSDLDRSMREVLVRDVANAMQLRVDQLEGDDCSRLAWLYMNLRDTATAKQVAELGLSRESDNIHCQRLIDRISRFAY